MELKNLSHHTQRAYLAAVTGIAKFYNQSPDKMTQEKIEDYLLYLKLDKGIAPNSCYGVLTGLRFFYKHVTEEEIPVTYSIRRSSRKLPEVLTVENIWKIICSAKNLKHKMILMTTYSAGLRASETLNLKTENIDSKTMLIKVEEGKGGKQWQIRLKRSNSIDSAYLNFSAISDDKEFDILYNVCVPNSVAGGTDGIGSAEPFIYNIKDSLF